LKLQLDFATRSFCAVILSNAIRISRGRIPDRRPPSPVLPATRASAPEARRHRFCPGRLLHFGPDLVGHCAPQGHLAGTAPFTSNRSALPKLPPTIIRTASTRLVAASHVTHTAVLRCAASNTLTRHPLPLLVNPLNTFLFDKVCVLVTPYLRVLLFQSLTAYFCERLCSPQPRFLSVLRILPSSHSLCSWLKASSCAFSSEAPSSNSIFHAIRLYRFFAVGHLFQLLHRTGSYTKQTR